MPCPSKEDYERDLRPHLLELGYELSDVLSGNENGYYLTTFENRFGFVQYKSTYYDNSYKIPTYQPNLMIAIASMRKGEDIHVGEYVKITGKQSAESLALDGQIKRVKAVSKHGLSKFGNGNLDVYDGIGGGIHLNEVRKATLQELIDKFGEKEPAAVAFVPKRGDVVYNEREDGDCSWISIYSVINGSFISNLCHLLTDGSKVPQLIMPASQSAKLKEQRLATDSEKQLLFDALKKAGKRYNAEKFCIEDITVTSILEPEEPKESVPARPLMVKATSDSKDGEFKKDGVYAVAKSEGGYDELYGYSFHAIGESGEAKYCMERGCAYMNYGDWIVLQREGEPEPKDLTTITVGDETMEVDNTKWIKDSESIGIRAISIEQDIPAFAKALAHKLADETTDFKEAFRLLELVRQEVEQIRQDTIANKTKQRDKLTDEINKLKAVTLK